MTHSNELRDPVGCTFAEYTFAIRIPFKHTFTKLLFALFLKILEFFETWRNLVEYLWSFLRFC